MRKPLLILVFSGLALATLNSFYPVRMAEAQSGSRTARKAHYDLLWAWLQRHDYRKWNGADGQAPDFQKGESPHGALVKIYVDKNAAADLTNLPSGSLIVKENYSVDKKLMAITLMQRSQGYDPDNGDWYYAKYMPDGKIARTPPEMKSMPIAGKFSKCIECHAGADGDDHAFIND